MVAARDRAGKDTRMSGSPSSPEWLAFDEGLKPGLRIWADQPRARQHAAAAERRGYASVVVDLPDESTAIAYIARTPAAARNLAELERANLPGRQTSERLPPSGETDERLGVALGFPQCCVDAFVVRAKRGVDVLASGETTHEDHVAATEAAAATAVMHSLLNIYTLTPSAVWLSYVPCRFDCEPSLTYAAELRTRYLQRFSDHCARIDEQLGRAIAIHRDGRRSTVADAQPGACLLRFDEP